jgi:hypothetical protein
VRFPAFCGALALGIALASAEASACSTTLTVNLTVELEPVDAGKNLLIELRQGAVGHSKVVNRQHFRGRTGTVYFAELCAGSYFMDIGNGPPVAVTPVREFDDGQRYVSTIRVSFTSGNVARRRRGGL